MEFASVAAAAVRPAEVLARYGESREAYDLLTDDGDDTALHVRLLAELGRYAEAGSLLSRTTPLVDGHDVYLHYLHVAALDLLAKRYDRALEAIAAIDSIADPDFDAYRDFIGLRANLAVGRAERAVRYGEAGQVNGLPEALSSEFDEAFVEALQAAGKDDRAIELVRSLRDHARGWKARAQWLHTEYELYARTGRVDDARRVALAFVSSYPGHEDAAAVADEIVASVEPSQMTVSELMQFAGFYVGASRFEEARALMRAIDARTLSGDDIESRRLLRAEYHYRAGDYQRAVAFAKPDYQNRVRKRRSMLILARSYRRLGKEESAARLYEYFAKTFPNDEKAAEALFVAAHIYDRTRDERARERVLEALTRSYPSSYYGRTAVLMTARQRMEQGKPGSAAEVLARLVKRSRGTDEAALYYLSRAYSGMEAKESSALIMSQLESLDPNSFYLHPDIPEPFRALLTTSTGTVALDGEGGLMQLLARSARRKNIAYDRIRTVLSEPGVGDEGDTYDECLRRGRWLMEAGLSEWGERELDTARRRCYDSPARMLEMGRVFDEFAMPGQSLRAYQRVRSRIPWSRRDEFAQDFLWLLYPTPYPVQVMENCARHGVPPHLAYAMIREESRFDSDAVSRVGALGLMQIMPETGRWVARELELYGWNEGDLLDPVINVAFGVWYASSLLEAAGGNPLWMLAAYNAGPGNAKRWFDGSGSDVIRTVDDIDFRETRTYVQRIVESANIYHSLYFGPDAAIARADR